jgi:hypothetical protein
VFVLPFRLAAIGPGGGFGGVTELRDTVTSGFVHLWSAGTGEISPDLATAADFWARFHVVKAALAAALLAVLVALWPRILSRVTRAATVSQWLAATAASAVSAVATVLALLVVVANVQGAVAPLSSVLGFLPVSGSDPALVAATAEARHALAAGQSAPALDVLVAHFEAYHVAMAWLGGAVTVGLLVGAVLLWRRRARVSRTDRRLRWLLLATAGATLALAAFFGVVTAANVSTALHPAPALLGFLQGGS